MEHSANHLDLLDLEDRADFHWSEEQGIVCARVEGDHICTRSEGHINTDGPCSCPCGFDF
jgi:hypothetical protein